VPVFRRTRFVKENFQIIRVVENQKPSGVLLEPCFDRIGDPVEVRIIFQRRVQVARDDNKVREQFFYRRRVHIDVEKARKSFMQLFGNAGASFIRQEALSFCRALCFLQFAHRSLHASGVNALNFANSSGVLENISTRLASEISLSKSLCRLSIVSQTSASTPANSRKIS
jgi:hypothetical protein